MVFGKVSAAIRFRRGPSRQVEIPTNQQLNAMHKRFVPGFVPIAGSHFRAQCALIPGAILPLYIWPTLYLAYTKQPEELS